MSPAVEVIPKSRLALSLAPKMSTDALCRLMSRPAQSTRPAPAALPPPYPSSLSKPPASTLKFCPARKYDPPRAIICPALTAETEPWVATTLAVPSDKSPADTKPISSVPACKSELPRLRVLPVPTVDRSKLLRAVKELPYTDARLVLPVELTLMWLAVARTAAKFASPPNAVRFKLPAALKLVSPLYAYARLKTSAPLLL